MLDWNAYPIYEQFRPLFDRTPGESMLVGEDVYALQTALTGCGQPCGPADGWFGPATGKAVWEFQTKYDLIRDGRAGPQTNRQLIVLLIQAPNSKYKLPVMLLFGQLAHECSLYPGRFSPARPAGDYDAGVAQRNTEHTPAKEGFNTPASISALAKNTREYYDLFEGIPRDRRRWMLAAGAWNAPAFACLIAYLELRVAYGGDEAARQAAAAQIPWQKRAKSISATNLAKFEAYMVDATKLMP